MNKLYCVGLLLASPLLALAHSVGNCVELTLPVTVTAETLVFAFPPFADGYQAEAFFSALTRRDGNPGALVAGTKNITETFSISAQYCSPMQKSHKSNTLQILTHGLGFDKRCISTFYI